MGHRLALFAVGDEKVSVNGIDMFCAVPQAAGMARKLRVEYPGAINIASALAEVLTLFETIQEKARYPTNLLTRLLCGVVARQ